MTAVIRALRAQDANDAIALYAALHPNNEIADARHFETMIARDDVTVIGGEISGTIVAMATLHLLPNMAYGRRPFGVVENVITRADHQNNGIMRAIMAQIHQTAWAANAYKIMLMTGVDTGAKAFYEKLGYSSDTKQGLQLRQVPPRLDTTDHGTVGGAH